MAVITLILLVSVLVYTIIRARRDMKHLVETLVATDEHISNARKYAIRRLCEDQGFAFTEAPDGSSYRCDHTAQTCARSSTYPQVTPAEDAETLPRPYLEWNTDMGACILGIAEYRKKCEEMGMRYDQDKGRCYVTEQYCNCKGLSWKDNNCWMNPLTKLYSYIAGDTLAIAMTATLNPAFYKCLINK